MRNPCGLTTAALNIHVGTLVPYGRFSALWPESCMFEIRFHRTSDVYLELVQVKSDAKCQISSGGVVRRFGEWVAGLDIVSSDNGSKLWSLSLNSPRLDSKWKLL
ncbi:hypothetical protein AVEN_211221-1 [Araneus ventricosus]|uniref:Uncharacterized protein n=1 Tax=Araneus ventricosus TaxID=182803 RepID=A0A4Y2M1H6_ARAVE|nr:hypothetical protein AVEN_211221-1 [Araneus ventricosus]